MVRLPSLPLPNGGFVMYCNLWLTESSRVPALWRHYQDAIDQKGVLLLWLAMITKGKLTSKRNLNVIKSVSIQRKGLKILCRSISRLEAVRLITGLGFQLLRKVPLPSGCHYIHPTAGPMPLHVLTLYSPSQLGSQTLPPTKSLQSPFVPLHALKTPKYA